MSIVLSLCFTRDKKIKYKGKNRQDQDGHSFLYVVSGMDWTPKQSRPKDQVIWNSIYLSPSFPESKVSVNPIPLSFLSCVNPCMASENANAHCVLKSLFRIIEYIDYVLYYYAFLCKCSAQTKPYKYDQIIYKRPAFFPYHIISSNSFVNKQNIRTTGSCFSPAAPFLPKWFKMSGFRHVKCLSYLSPPNQ